jgi:hypothetical protein
MINTRVSPSTLDYKYEVELNRKTLTLLSLLMANESTHATSSNLISRHISDILGTSAPSDHGLHFSLSSIYFEIFP